MRVPSFASTGLVGQTRTQEQLAAIAQAAWHSEGHTNVRFWVEPKKFHFDAATIAGRFYPEQNVVSQEIRSNLVNGLPPRAGKHAIAA